MLFTRIEDHNPNTKGLGLGLWPNSWFWVLETLTQRISEIARVKGFALDGQGLLEAATVKVTDYCADGADCTTERTDEATERK